MYTVQENTSTMKLLVSCALRPASFHHTLCNCKTIIYRWSFVLLRLLELRGLNSRRDDWRNSISRKMRNPRSRNTGRPCSRDRRILKDDWGVQRSSPSFVSIRSKDLMEVTKLRKLILLMHQKVETDTNVCKRESWHAKCVAKIYFHLVEKKTLIISVFSCKCKVYLFGKVN